MSLSHAGKSGGAAGITVAAPAGDMGGSAERPAAEAEDMHTDISGPNKSLLGWKLLAEIKHHTNSGQQKRVSCCNKNGGRSETAPTFCVFLYGTFRKQRLWNGSPEIIGLLQLRLSDDIPYILIAAGQDMTEICPPEVFHQVIVVVQCLGAVPDVEAPWHIILRRTICWLCSCLGYGVMFYSISC